MVGERARPAAVAVELFGDDGRARGRKATGPFGDRGELGPDPDEEKVEELQGGFMGLRARRRTGSTAELERRLESRKRVSLSFSSLRYRHSAQERSFDSPNHEDGSPTLRPRLNHERTTLAAASLDSLLLIQLLFVRSRRLRTRRLDVDVALLVNHRQRYERRWLGWDSLWW